MIRWGRCPRALPWICTAKNSPIVDAASLIFEQAISGICENMESPLRGLSRGARLYDSVRSVSNRLCFNPVDETLNLGILGCAISFVSFLPVSTILPLASRYLSFAKCLHCFYGFLQLKSAAKRSFQECERVHHSSNVGRKPIVRFSFWKIDPSGLEQLLDGTRSIGCTVSTRRGYYGEGRTNWGSTVESIEVSTL